MIEDNIEDVIVEDKKRILIQLNISEGPIGVFFKTLGYELCHEYLDENEYEFIYGDFELSTTDIPRVRFEDDCSFKYEDNDLLKADTIVFDNPIAVSLIRDFFEKDHSFFRLENIKEATIINLKLQDYLNLGFLIDSIIIIGYKNNFNILKLRMFLNEMCDILFHKIDSAFNTTPIEINYLFDEKSFKVHFEFGCHQVEILKDELIQKKILEMSNLSELIFLKRRSKAIFKCVFFKDHKLNGIHAFSFKDLGEHEEDNIFANDFMAISGLEDHDMLSFEELENDDFSDRISLGMEELEELVQHLSSHEEDDDESVIIASKKLEEIIKQRILDNSHMSLSELKTSIKNEFSGNHQTQALMLFDRLVSNLKKDQMKKDKASSSNRAEAYRLKVSLQKSLSLIKNKEALIKKMRRDAELKSDHQKQEIKSLNTKLRQLREEFNDIKDKAANDARLLAMKSEASISSRENREVDAALVLKATKEIEALKNELKESADAHKATQHEVKKLEQKLRFSNAQYDSLFKRKNAGSQGASKAEVLRFKQDIAIQNAKIADLERKLAHAEKKSA